MTRVTAHEYAAALRPRYRTATKGVEGRPEGYGPRGLLLRIEIRSFLEAEGFNPQR